MTKEFNFSDVRITVLSYKVPRVNDKFYLNSNAFLKSAFQIY